MLEKNTIVQMKLDDKYYDVGIIRRVQILSKAVVPKNLQEGIDTNYALLLEALIIAAPVGTAPSAGCFYQYNTVPLL